MPLGLKNAPPTYKWIVNMAFQDYLGIFMKLFLDYFNMFSDFSIHILINFGCVMTTTKNLILTLTWRYLCSWYTLGSLSYILYPKRANFWIQFFFDNSQNCNHQKPQWTYRFSRTWPSFIVASSMILHSPWHHQSPRCCKNMKFLIGPQNIK
jgi:hypothetical protein